MMGKTCGQTLNNRFVYIYCKDEINKYILQHDIVHITKLRLRYDYIQTPGNLPELIIMRVWGTLGKLAFDAHNTIHIKRKMEKSIVQ